MESGTTSTAVEQDCTRLQQDYNHHSPLPALSSTPTPARIPPFKTPFKRPRTTRTLSLTPPPSSLTASPLDPSLTPAPRRPRPRTAFKVPFSTRTATSAPTSSSPTRPSSSRVRVAAEITTLNRRVHLLRQAHAYEFSQLMGERQGESELERLCEKWGEAGRYVRESESILSFLSSDSFLFPNSLESWLIKWSG